MQQTTAIQVLPAVSDNSTYYVELQPSTAGRTTSLYVSPTLTFVPATKSLTTTGNITASGFFYSNGTALSASGGSAISVADEGSSLTTGVTSFNFVGAGVTATAAGTSVTVTISGGGGSGSPGGSDTQVQFNDGGSFGGNAALTFVKTTGNLTSSNLIAGNTTTGGVFANTVTFAGTAANVIAMVFNSANVSIDFVLR